MKKVNNFEKIVKSLSEANPNETTSVKGICNNLEDGFNAFLESQYDDSIKYAGKDFFEKSLKEWDERSGPFSDYGNNPHEKIKIYNSFQKYKNQIVFDLGSGVVPVNTYTLLNKIGAKGYVGVEPFNYEKGKDNFEAELEYFKKEKVFDKFIPYALIKSDMKSILEKLPNNSSSFIASGIDWTIIKDDDYFEECNYLIQEKLHPKGIFISLSSDFFLGSNGFKKVDIWRPRHEPLMMVEKNE